MEETKILRKLDDYERFLWLPDQKNCFNQSLVVGLLPNSIDCIKLQQALNLLLNKYSILKTTIKGRKQPYFQMHSTGKTTKVELVVMNDADIINSVKTELHKPFPKLQGPFFRARLLKNINEDVLIFTSHHLITDGISLNYLLSELLKMVFSEECLPNVRNLTNVPMPKPISKYTTTTRALEEKVIFNTNASNCNIPENETEKLKTGLIFGKINEEKLRKIYSSCKKRGVKIHSFLACCLYSAFFEFISISSKDKAETIIYECPVNLRNLITPAIPTEFLGCYMATLCTKIKRKDSNSFWKLVKDMDIKLRDKLDESLVTTTVNSVASLMKNSKSFASLKKFRNPHCPFFGFSNLGKLETLLPFQNKIQYIFPSVALQGTFYDKYNLYCALNTFKNQIFLSLLYPSPMMKDEQAHQILSSFFEKINYFATTEFSTKSKKVKQVA